MRMKSQVLLVTFLEERSKLRRRELRALEQLLKQKRDHELETLCRTSIVLSYANWEGFVKESSVKYIEFVSCQSLKISDLADNFRAVLCRSMLLRAAQATKRISPHLDLIQEFQNNTLSTQELKPDSAIDTESNLDAEVFKNICMTVGVSYDGRWSTWGPFINDLVRNRCAIAHGESMPPSKKYAEESIKFVDQAICWFKTDIENAAVNRSYMCPKILSC